MKRKRIKDLAYQRIERLIAIACSNASKDLSLAKRQAEIARRISMRYRVRMPYHIKQLFCKNCKQFIVPGINARVRIGRSNIKAIRITCLECKHVYRKVIK